MNTFSMKEIDSFEHKTVFINEELYTHCSFEFTQSTPGTINVRFEMSIFRRNSDVLLKTIKEIYVIRINVCHLKTYIPTAFVIQMVKEGHIFSHKYTYESDDIELQFFLSCGRKEQLVTFGMDCEVHSERDESLLIKGLYNLII